MGDEQLVAPGDLEIVRRFVNTRDLELGIDALSTPAALRHWLADNALLDTAVDGPSGAAARGRQAAGSGAGARGRQAAGSGAGARGRQAAGSGAGARGGDVDEVRDLETPTAADLERTVELREALRELLLANATGEQPPGAALAVVDEIGRRATLRVDGLRLTPAVAGVDGALARLLAIVVTAQADGSWARLKACPGDGCAWALYDRTRSRTRTWCAAAKCGARTRSRAYRRRRASQAVAPDATSSSPAEEVSGGGTGA